ncbi:cytochrome C [Methylocystis bryophila]|uniref:Cytochrome C n=1 Tax=Methylocystis bryophila TaxID=655015 RepID=A0A1W6N0R4_9HYPH|nr:cytochrome C [Methylocystis bryophila]
MRRLSALYWLLLCDVAHSASLLDRGQYLVEALMACDNCHTPRSTEGYDYSRRFSGGSQVFTDKDYSVRGSNISPDLESGVGPWSDAELKAAIVSGVSPKGRLAPVMPSESYRALTPNDLNAVVAFLRAKRPIKSDAPPQERHGALEPRRAIPGAETPLSDAGLADPLQQGLYVASLARCMSCHSGETDGAPDPERRLGQGGRIFRTPAGATVASNITSHPTKGVGAWTDQELKRAIIEGTGRDGKPLAPTMANLSKAHFSKMAERDIEALIAWLRTTPPKE